LGPYREPVKDTWLDNRIDPQLFQDEDGKLYLYMVKFTDGNTVWVRPMKDPATFSGDPRYLFASLPGTWETLDNRVAEGPWVIRYRDQYYLMYNANHTSPRWGNYTLGVAQADGPMGFGNGNKYPHPVVMSNQTDLEDNFPDLLRFSGEEPGLFYYTFEEPGGNWNRPGFKAEAWQKGKAGFGSDVLENSTTRRVSTKWKAGRIWLRKAYHLDTGSAGNLSLRMHHDGDTRVFLNGTLVYQGQGRQYVHHGLEEKAAALLKNGENILAVESRAGERANFLDVSLFDLKSGKAEDILFSPGQPNILRGPNGFEWWLVYMANKNAERRGQYISRVHFHDKKLVTEGITGPRTPGYHPPPAPPDLAGLFNGEDLAGTWKAGWKVLEGTWLPGNKEMLQAGSTQAAAVPKSRPAAHYLFEAAVNIRDTAGKAGILACRKDEDNWLRILLDRQQRKWSYVLKQKGRISTFSFRLPRDFNYRAYHTFRIYKNGPEFSIRLNGLPAPGQTLIK
ncbi:MAG TPA: family 43 glycosylhydrolase, partial [Anseongella sp.]|nr:family 43 glycosylhydrolase [Anseongella sp.]